MKSVKINPFNIIGISVRTTNEKEQSTKEIADLWEQFMSKNILSNIPNKVDQLYVNFHPYIRFVSIFG